MLNASCPSCGAPIAFVNKASLIAVCAHCGNSVLREDINLRTLGVVAELQDDGSVIELGTSGAYRDRGFRVVGRIQRSYARGFWNDWFLAFDSGEPGWLSEAMGFTSILFETVPDAPVPPLEKMDLGRTVRIRGETHWVKSILQGECAGVEGELPFRFGGPTSGTFVDLAAERRRCATISYVGSSVRTLAGEYVPFDALKLRDIRRPENW